MGGGGAPREVRDRAPGRTCKKTGCVLIYFKILKRFSFFLAHPWKDLGKTASQIFYTNHFHKIISLAFLLGTRGE